MGLLNGSHQQYYQGEDHGNYQFVSLTDIINQFMFVYVGEDKIIPKARRADVAFHAQRALAELSFDTFKSCKAQEISVPASLQMTLPHDYVNYTKLSWVDSAGIKHPIYPTNATSNPFSILQNDAGEYTFVSTGNLVTSGDFTSLSGWSYSENFPSNSWSSTFSTVGNFTKYYKKVILDFVSLESGELVFNVHSGGSSDGKGGRAFAAWQKIDTSNLNAMDLKASAASAAQQHNASNILICDFGTVRVGITTTNPGVGWLTPNPGISTDVQPIPTSANYSGYQAKGGTPNEVPEHYDLDYLEWKNGDSSQKELENIDVSAYNEVWVYVQSISGWKYPHAGTPLITGTNGGLDPITPEASANNTPQQNTVDFIEINEDGASISLSPVNEDGNSTAWNNYKSNASSENQDDYQDDTYWPMNGSRYGLDPQYANVNGSFYIDCVSGKIHFSSNIAGKTVILDYISDSLGTNEEMQVHKFAEEAMYKWISHAVMAGRINIPEYQVNRFKKERFAAIRTAKLRLSNIKLEEITQIMRGKSKQIKH